MSKFKVGDRVVVMNNEARPDLRLGDKHTVAVEGVLCVKFDILGDWCSDERLVLDISATANAQADKLSSYATIRELLQAAGSEGLTAKEIELRTGVKAHKRLPEMRGTDAWIKTDDFGTPVTRVVEGRRSRVWVGV